MTATRIMTAAVAFILLIGILGCLSACSIEHQLEPAVRTQEVDIPVGQALVPPDELKPSPIAASAVPHFVAPTAAGASSCMVPADEAKLRALIEGRESKLDAWEKWGFVP